MASVFGGDFAELSAKMSANYGFLRHFPQKAFVLKADASWNPSIHHSKNTLI
jgi:hypothetical protein